MESRMKVTLLFGGPGVEHNISASTLKPWVTTLHGAEDIELNVFFLCAASPLSVPTDSDVFAYPTIQWWDLPKKFFFANTCEDFSSPGQLNEAGSSYTDDPDNLG